MSPSSQAVLHISGDAIPVRPNSDHEWLLESKLVAKGYGIAETTLRDHRASHGDELFEGKHFIIVNNGKTVAHGESTGYGFGKGAQRQILWTKRGVVRLGFFIRSERAKSFRDAAEDLILRQAEKTSMSIIDAAKAIVAQSEIIEAIQPAHPFGSLNKDGKPRTGLRRAAYVAAANRFKEAALLMKLSGQIEMELGLNSGDGK